ncbi:8868_t:CDS:1, partial [Paraglomus brasilianum]
EDLFCHAIADIAYEWYSDVHTDGATLRIDACVITKFRVKLLIRKERVRRQDN